VSFWTVADGLVDDRVEDLWEDREGILWIATLGGISRFEGSRFHNYTIADGLPNNQVRCICEDRRGRLWFGTDAGAVVYDRQVFQTARTGCVAAITCIIEDREGHLWFATQDGAVRYQPGRIPPRVRVTQVVADQVFREPTKVEVFTGNRPVIFEYKGMSFRTAPRDMLYTCRLVGYEEDWQPPTRQQRAFYPGLPVGDYTFQVKALDRDLNASEPAEVHLVIEPDPQVEGLTEALRAGSSPGEFVGESPALRRVLQQLEQVASTDLTVLVLGETGTGKGLAARTLHQGSDRRNGPFIQVNCGAIPEGLVESELFGHEKGAFTSAVSRRLGKVELAVQGTLFLDEIGDLSLPAQSKLLRLLEERTFERVGGTRTLTADVRIVAATNRDLTQMVQDGTFREDLYFRLNAFPVELPPLRARQEDIELLALYFAEQMAAHLRKEIAGFESKAVAALQARSWPGNIRELAHVVQRGVIVCRAPTITAQDLGLDADSVESISLEAMLSPEEYERRYLEKVLEKTGGLIKGARGAAALLGVAPSTLRSRLQKLGITRSRNPG